MDYNTLALQLDNYFSDLELYFNYREDTLEFQVFTPDKKKALIRVILSETEIPSTNNSQAEAANKNTAKYNLDDSVYYQSILDIKKELQIFDS